MIHQNLIDRVIIDARIALADWRIDSVSAATHRDYFKTAKMLQARGGTLADARCERTFYKWRAALVYHRKFELSHGLAALEMIVARDRKDVTPHKVDDLVLATQETIKAVMAQPSKKGLETAPGEGEFKKQNTCQQKQRPHLGKRPLLGLLPKDWMKIIWEIAKRSRYQDAVAVLALTGCRPSELAHGVRCTVTENNQLAITIIGAKTGRQKKFGQEERTLVLPIQQDEAFHLAGICIDRKDVTHTVKIRKARNITDVMRNWSKRLWPRRSNNCLTPYVYRQAAFARFKKKWDAETVAVAMGQSSDRTQQKYGTRNQAGNGAIPVAVWGSTAVRHHASTNSKRPKQGLKKNAPATTHDSAKGPTEDNSLSI